MISYEQEPLKQTQQKEKEKNDLSGAQTPCCALHKDLFTRILENLFLSVPTLSSYCGHVASAVVINMILMLYGAMWTAVRSQQLEVLIRLVINEGQEDAPWWTIWLTCTRQWIPSSAPNKLILSMNKECIKREMRKQIVNEYFIISPRNGFLIVFWCPGYIANPRNVSAMSERWYLHLWIKLYSTHRRTWKIRLT